MEVPRRLSAEPSARDVSEYVMREVVDPEEIVGVLRLRHRIYFEQSGYGEVKPMHLDLTAHDVRSRFFGVFRGTAMIGGSRVVFREEQPAAPLLRAIRAVVGDVVAVAPPPALPSEEAFDLRAALGARAELVDVELGRLALVPSAAPAAIAGRVVVATLAAAHAAGCRFYLYSCAAAIAQRYARFTNPRYSFDTPSSNAIHSDGFVFPKPTVAAVATPQDSPYWSTIQRDAAVLRDGGGIVLIPLERSKPASMRPLRAL